MSLQLIAPPDEEPVSLDALKAHLGVDGEAQDGLIAALGLAARQAVEARAGLALIAQGWRASFDAAPGGAFRLPLAPVASIDAVTASRLGESVPVSADVWETDPADPGRLRFIAPVARDNRIGAILVDFTAGWPNAAAVPGDLKQAVMRLAAHYYEHREVAGTARFHRAPEGLGPLLAPYRRVRL